MDNIINKIKNGWSIAVNEASKLGKTVAGETNDLVDRTKLTLTANDTEKKIAELQKKIGELVYEQYLESGETEFSEICQQIDEFNIELNALKAQIAEIKSTVACPECGQNNDKKSGFCSKCGAKLAKDDESETEDMVIEVTEIEEE